LGVGGSDGGVGFLLGLSLGTPVGALETVGASDIDGAELTLGYSVEATGAFVGGAVVGSAARLAKPPPFELPGRDRESM